MVQVDNPDPDAHYLVVLAAPAAAQRLAILPSALDARPVAGGGAQALALRAAMWRRRPAGVLCVERIEVGMTCTVNPQVPCHPCLACTPCGHKRSPGVLCKEPKGKGQIY